MQSLAGGDSELQVGKAFFGEDGDVFQLEGDICLLCQIKNLLL